MILKNIFIIILVSFIFQNDVLSSQKKQNVFQNEVFLPRLLKTLNNNYNKFHSQIPCNKYKENLFLAQKSQISELFKRLKKIGILNIIKEDIINSQYNNFSLESGYNFDEKDIDTIFNILQEISDDNDVNVNEILKNYGIIEKLIFTYKSSVVIGKEYNQKKSFIKSLIKKYLTFDKATEYIKAHPNLSKYFNKLSNENVFSRAYIIFQNTSSYERDFLLDKLFNNKISDTDMESIMKNNQHEKMQRASFSVFFNAKNHPYGLHGIEDPDTLTIFDYIFWAYTKGLTGIEIPIDFLPFDLSKRLPNEFSKLEKLKIKELSEYLGVKITVHSPLVGPFTKTNPLYMDPADNLEIYNAAIDFCNDIGAESLVVHIVETKDKNINAMVKMLIKAKSLGNLKIAFENSHNKNKEYITSDNFCDMIEKVAETLGKENKALKNLAITFDSAHFNIVSSNEDPLVSLMKIIFMSEKLHSKYRYFDKKDFLKELHLNQNLGPIIYSLGYGADIHEDLESKGPINNKAIITTAYSLGYSPIVVAEQSRTVSDKGLKMISDTVTIGYEERKKGVNYEELSKESEEVRTVLNSLFKSEKKIEGLKKYYSDKAQITAYNLLYKLFGKNELIEHIKNREMMYVFSALSEPLIEINGVGIENKEEDEIIIKKNDSINDDSKMYFIIDGSVEVVIPLKYNERKSLIIEKGNFFGEVALLSKDKNRNATVYANSKNVRLLTISKKYLNSIMEEYPIMAALLKQHKMLREKTTRDFGNILELEYIYSMLLNVWREIPYDSLFNINDVIENLNIDADFALKYFYLMFQNADGRSNLRVFDAKNGIYKKVSLNMEPSYTVNTNMKSA